MIVLPLRESEIKDQGSDDRTKPKDQPFWRFLRTFEISEPNKLGIIPKISMMSRSTRSIRCLRPVPELPRCLRRGRVSNHNNPEVTQDMKLVTSELRITTTSGTVNDPLPESHWHHESNNKGPLEAITNKSSIRTILD